MLKNIHLRRISLFAERPCEGLKSLALTADAMSKAELLNVIATNRSRQQKF